MMDTFVTRFKSLKLGHGVECGDEGVLFGWKS